MSTADVTARPVVLAIGGSDSAGMAGIQQDARVIEALGGHAATAVTAATAQNGSAVASVNPVPDRALEDQLQAALALSPAAVKIGLLASAQQAAICERFLEETGIPAILDPVLSASSGEVFANNGTADAIRQLARRCTLTTPNRDEAEVLFGTTPGSSSAAMPPMVVKGGHAGGAWSADYYCCGERRFWLRSPRVNAPATRGTGCAFASAAATAFALGYALEDAVVVAKMSVNQGLRQGTTVNDLNGPVRVTAFPGDGRDLPELVQDDPQQPRRQAFPSCGAAPLGLYPVVDRSEWLERLLPLGVTTIQLRIKDLEGSALRDEIERGIALARQYEARLFINDYWQLAIELGAYGVHLGHEDLDTADLDAIHRAGLRLGLSTHCHHEVARAHHYRPSYLACGPVYPTTTKDMPWTPHGPVGLGYWRRTLADYPLVAIGGIDRDRIVDVAATGAAGVAMITAITNAPDPEATTRSFMGLLEECHD